MNNLIEIFPKLAQLLPKAVQVFIYFGMSLVSFYHGVSENTFLNTAFENSKGFEKIGNLFFTPLHYLCEGKSVHYDEQSESYTLTQRFDYESKKSLYSPLSISTLPQSLILGSVMKGLAFLSPKIRERHHKLKAFISAPIVKSNNAYFRSFGIKVEDFRVASSSISQNHQRRPGSENHLSHDKEALIAIVTLLSEHQIPFWVDCGTCLGAYRYGGIIPWDNDLDLAVIKEDFDNVFHLLHRLDPAKFVVQDWSNRGRPKTYIRVYVKESRNHIDIYHNQIDGENHTLTNILSQGESNFMVKGWKIRERMFCKPIPFDVIFPLKKASFDGIEVPVPNQIDVYLSSKYGPNLAPVMVYNAETDAYEKDLSHPYWGIPLAH